jgi:NAD dependent epimerase/dehydratase family enzyme
VHADDVVNLFIESIEDNNISGAVNAVSPNPVTMNEFAKTLGRIMKRPAIFKVPAFVLKIVLGEASIEVLTGAKIYPKRTIELGYKFEFENLSDALENILEKQ